MALNLHDHIVAPVGMDNTSDATALGDKYCQNLVNLLPDRTGCLRGGAQLLPVGLGTIAAGIDGLGVLYAQQPYLANGATILPQPTKIVLCSNGVVTVTPANAFAAWPPTWNTGAQTSTSPSGFLAGQRVRMAGYGQELYLVQETNTLGNFRITYAGQVRPMGQNQPPQLAYTLQTPTSGPVQKSGVVQYVQTWIDELGRESSPSLPLTINYGTGATRDALLDCGSLFTTDSQAVQANIYATLANGSQFYLIATLSSPTRTFEDNTPDTLVQAGQAAPAFGENDKPKPASLIAAHRDRVVLNQIGTQNIQISNAGSATQFNSLGIRLDSTGAITNPSDGITLAVGNEQGDSISNFATFGSVLAVFKRRSIWLLHGQDLTDFEVKQVHTVGCIAPDSLLQVENMVIWLAEDGVRYVDGDFMTHKLSKQIETSLRAVLSSPAGYALAQKAQAWYVDNVYHLAIGSTIYCYDFDSQGWYTLSFGPSTFGCCATMHEVGLPGFVLLGRSDTNTVDILDIYSPNIAVTGMVYRTRAMQTPLPWHLSAQIGQQPERIGRKEPLRVNLFGEGTNVTGQITLRIDARTVTYNFSLASLVDGILVEQEFPPHATGRMIDATFTLSGTNVFLRDVEIDFGFVG